MVIGSLVVMLMGAGIGVVVAAASDALGLSQELKLILTIVTSALAGLTIGGRILRAFDA